MMRYLIGAWLSLLALVLVLVLVLLSSVVTIPGGATIDALWAGAIAALCVSAFVAVLIPVLSEPNVRRRGRRFRQDSASSSSVTTAAFFAGSTFSGSDAGKVGDSGAGDIAGGIDC